MRIAPNTGAQPARQPTDASAGAMPLDADQVSRALENLFPGVLTWFGSCTGHWWAMLGDRLLDACSPQELADKIRAALTIRPAGRMDGSSSMCGRGRGVGRGGYVR